MVEEFAGEGAAEMAELTRREKPGRVAAELGYSRPSADQVADRCLDLLPGLLDRRQFLPERPLVREHGFRLNFADPFRLQRLGLLQRVVQDRENVPSFAHGVHLFAGMGCRVFA